jgi:hypothetical protein
VGAEWDDVGESERESLGVDGVDFVDFMDAFDLERLENLPEWESERNPGSTSEEGVSLLVFVMGSPLSSLPTSFFFLGLSFFSFDVTRPRLDRAEPSLW